MAFSSPELSEFVLSPTERRQRHDVMGALSTLQAAVKELQNRAEIDQPNLRCREILQNSNKAIGTLQSFLNSKFKLG
jgi:hypothetical protein